MVWIPTLMFMWRQRSIRTVVCWGSSRFLPTLPVFEALLGWLVGFGPVNVVGVEGTGSWGVGLARFLHDQGIETVEVDRPKPPEAP